MPARPPGDVRALIGDIGVDIPVAVPVRVAVRVRVAVGGEHGVVRQEHGLTCGRGLLRLLGDSAGLSAAALVVILLLRAAALPGVDYALYVWKDIYIVVLIEAFYTYTNTVFPIGVARWAYGLFGVLSALGAEATRPKPRAQTERQ